VHPEPAVSWHSGFRRGAHARRKATPFHHAARRRVSRVAAHGACATTTNAAHRGASGRQRQGRSALAAQHGGIPARATAIGLDRRPKCELDYRWPAGDADKACKYAAELVALAPDVILTASSISLAALLQTTRTVPIVFVGVADPVGTGF